ncbi:MAG: 50S ribosome-binding GTPase [Mycoplasmoidaceae bacterium]|nr:50S ribosome-binding GTPase [Mycoplasmoidaceae bacterium]
MTNTNAPFQTNIQQQVLLAINEADTIIFLVSEKDGINKDDYYVAKLLKKYRAKNVILAVNKAENKQGEYEKMYYSLGYGKPNYIAAEHSIGIGDLLDLVVKRITTSPTSKEFKTTKFCVIGRPNVGKSTLVNAILNEERVIVSDIAGTTRDSIDCNFKYNNKNYTIIDTAGIRRKSRISDQIERFALTRTTDAISRSELILLVLDASEDFNEQDEVIGGLAFDANIPTIIVVNK